MTSNPPSPVPVEINVVAALRDRMRDGYILNYPVTIGECASATLPARMLTCQGLRSSIAQAAFLLHRLHTGTSSLALPGTWWMSVKAVQLHRGPERPDHRRALPCAYRSHDRRAAEAMVVTSSRLHAVRYKQAIDAYIHRKGLP